MFREKEKKRKERIKRRQRKEKAIFEEFSHRRVHHTVILISPYLEFRVLGQSPFRSFPCLHHSLHCSALLICNGCQFYFYTVISPFPPRHVDRLIRPGWLLRIIVDIKCFKSSFCRILIIRHQAWKTARPTGRLTRLQDCENSENCMIEEYRRQSCVISTGKEEDQIEVYLSALFLKEIKKLYFES